MVKVEYHIISGKVIETRRGYMNLSARKKVRGQRIAGNTSLRKIAANEREQNRRLARTLNCNFGSGLMLVTLKYSNARLPKSYEEACEVSEKYLRKVRNAYKKATGETLLYVNVNANWSPKHNCPARLHHHIVLPADVSLDLLEKCWAHGEFHVKRVNNPSDLSGLADYLCRNVRCESGKKKYTTAKNMAKPICTEPKIVDDVESIPALPKTSVVDAQQTKDEDGVVVGAYLRAIAAEPIKVRGGMVILPKHGRKKDRAPVFEMDEVLNYDE